MGDCPGWPGLALVLIDDLSNRKAVEWGSMLPLGFASGSPVARGKASFSSRYQQLARALESINWPALLNTFPASIKRLALMFDSVLCFLSWQVQCLKHNIFSPWDFSSDL